MASSLALFVILASCALAQSQRPQQEPGTASADQPAAPDPRGTNAAPLIIKVQPTPKTDEETAKEQAQIDSEESTKRWTKWLGIGTFLVGLLQLFAIGFQVRIASRQNTIIEQQNVIMAAQRDAADRQSEYMRDGLTETRSSISEATKSAAAMESIATSMADNTTIIRESLGFSSEMAAANRLIATNQRAYLAVVRFTFGPHGRERVPTYTVELFNSGQLPATITEWATVLYTEESLPSPCEYDGLIWRPISGVAPPGKPAIVSGDSISAEFTQDIWTNIENGAFAVSFHVVIRYQTGIAGLVGETSIGAVYEPDMTRLPAHQRFIYTNIAGYNYAR